MTTSYKSIAESNNFIVLDRYTKQWQVNDSYQSESDLERELIKDLTQQATSMCLTSQHLTHDGQCPYATTNSQ